MTQEELFSILDYDKSTGIFRWKITASRTVPIGSIAGSIHNKKGYRKVCYKGKMYYLHRLAMLYVYGEMPKYVDHIDGVRDNNRIDNLRACTKSQNNFNSKVYKTNSTGYKNIYFNDSKNKFIVSFKVSGKSFSSSADTLEEAIEIAKLYREILHKDFALDTKTRFQPQYRDK